MTLPIDPPALLDAPEIAELVERRRRVRAWWRQNPAAADARWSGGGEAPVGLALSGGGIRSATFSLGLIQALAKSTRGALDRVDVLSTVSGGGYAGCFLRSLFVPPALRGIDPPAPAAVPDLSQRIADQYRFARHALAGNACEREIAPPPGVQTETGKLRNPLWWLREHSRYLAPTGMTDFGFAIAYIARNWLAMAVLVVLACVAIGSVVVLAEGLLLTAFKWPAPATILSLPVSPLFLLGVLPIAAGAQLMVAYWATQAMSVNERAVTVQRQRLLLAIGAIAGAALATALLLGIVYALAPEPLGKPDLSQGIGTHFIGLLGACIVVSLSGAAIAWLVAQALSRKAELLATELRRTLTSALAWAHRILAIVILCAAIDTFGAWLDRLLQTSRSVSSVGAMLLPVLAFVIKKLPDWFGGGSRTGGGGGGIGGLLKRFANVVAFAVGVTLYAMLAILALAIVHHAMWPGGAYAAPAHWYRVALLTGTALILVVVLGRSTGFINLSSLHAFYSSRLTRAYLGATNVARLDRIIATDRGAPITENHAGDYIRPSVYGETDLPAPIHVIGVTLNETIDPRSQIVSRDRKGRMLSVEPDGVREDVRLIPWDALRMDPADPTRGAEGISLGQWIAISGAAASSGMGRMTNLGFALAFTFANVRLGYWWWAPRLCPDVPASTGVFGWLGRNFGTFVYLFNEMTCRYSRGYYRKYLTDGGHYENSGAYPLIRRRVPLILVTDNGADPDYAFADLETLVRQVRIDLGGETTILGGPALDVALARFGATDRTIFVDPQADPAWRRAMTDHQAPAYVLVLEVAIAGETLTMVWIKPRLIPGVPTDVAGYQQAMPAFPQQPTGDQFFDEAQWESYRRLGELSMTRLLNTCPKLLARPADPRPDQAAHDQNSCVSP